MFENKTLLITGGTGSFGNAVHRRFLSEPLKELRIFSRDEKKQDDMRKKYNDVKLSFYIGDVRDRDSVRTAMRGVDYVYHAAALKQVPSCEFHPMEAVKTNVMGTENVLEAAIQCEVERVICLSTDKAVYPINAMGISKAMMEKVAIAKARNSNKTQVAITRYGNVMGSRGSVIPLFIRQLQSGQPITITDPSMTRFMMSLDEAVDLVLYAFQNLQSGDLFVQKSPAATVATLAQALKELFGLPHHPVNVIGTRHGEKVYEVLLSREEKAVAQDLGGYFRCSPDGRDLNYDRYVDSGVETLSVTEDYNSHNTRILDVEGMKEILMRLDFVRNAVGGKLTGFDDGV